VIVITVAKKAVIGSVALNASTYGTGGLNIKATRISIDLDVDASQLRVMNRSKRVGGDGWGMSTVSGDVPQVVHPEGRWPANLILEHRSECRQLGTRDIRSRKEERPEQDEGRMDKTNWRFRPTPATSRGYGNQEGIEIIDVWNCATDCPVRFLDSQSGILKSGDLLPHHHRGGGCKLGTFIIRDRTGEPGFLGDEGGASRYFKQVKG
jgi:hypothetical protein